LNNLLTGILKFADLNIVPPIDNGTSPDANLIVTPIDTNLTANVTEAVPIQSYAIVKDTGYEKYLFSNPTLNISGNTVTIQADINTTTLTFLSSAYLFPTAGKCAILQSFLVDDPYYSNLNCTQLQTELQNQITNGWPLIQNGIQNGTVSLVGSTVTATFTVANLNIGDTFQIGNHSLVFQIVPSTSYYTENATLDTGRQNFTHLNINQSNSPYTNLTLYFSFDEGGNISAYDLSPSNLLGTYNGGATNASGLGVYGGALNETGSTPFVSVTDTLGTNSSTLWYKNSTSSTWTFIANSTGTLYVNGVAATPNQYPLFISGNTVSVGKLTSSTYFNGTIDEVMIFNDSLTAQQILDIYNNQSIRFVKNGIQSTISNNGNISGDNRANVTVTDLQSNMGSNATIRLGEWSLAKGYNVSDPNLVFYYPLDSQNASNVTLDITGRLNLTCGSAPCNVTGTGLYNNSFNTNANLTAYYGGTDSTNVFNNGMSVGVWIKKNSNAGGDIVGELSGGLRFLVSSQVASTFMDCQFYNQSSTLGTAETSVVNTNDFNWHFLVCQYNNSQIQFYIDGVLRATSTSISGNLSNGTKTLNIGSRNGGSGSINSSIEDVSIWNKSLSQSEISLLYSRGRANWNFLAWQNISYPSPNVFVLNTTDTNLIPEINMSSDPTYNFYTPLVYLPINVTTYFKQIIVNLDTPANATYTPRNISYTSDYNSDFPLVNATLYLWNSTGSLIATNTSNVSGVSNSSNLTVNFANTDTYYWNYLVCDVLQCSYNATNFTVYYDPTNPVILYQPPTLASGTSQSRNFVEVNVTAQHALLNNITLNFYNASGSLLQTNTVGTSPLFENYTSLAEGLYFYNGTACTIASACSNLPTRNITLDTENPLAVLNLPVDNYAPPSQNNINFSVNTTDNIGLSNATLRFWNQSDVISNQTVITISGTAVNLTTNFTLPDGIFKWQFIISDLAGNLNTTVNRTITIDTTPPQIAFVSPTYPNAANVNANAIPANLSYTEVHFLNITYSLYNLTALVNQSTFLTPVTFLNWTNLAEGDYRYNVTSTDTNGNTNSTETRTIRLDTTNPNITSISPANNTVSNNPNNNFTANATDNLGIKNYTLFIYNSTGGIANQTTTIVSTLTPSIVSRIVGIVVNLPNDIYTWFYNIFDWAGNTAVSENRTLNLTHFQPQLVITYPLNNSYINKTLIETNFTESQDPILDSCWTTRDNGLTNTTRACVDGVPFLFNDTYLDGPYNFTVYANDTAGLSSSVSIRFTTDTVFPTIQFQAPTPANNTNLSSQASAVNVTGTEINILNVNLSINNLTTVLYPASCTNNAGNYNCFYGPIFPDGDDYFNVTILDQAGHSNITETRVVHVDSTPPLISFVSPTNPSGTVVNANFFLINVSTTELHLLNTTISLFNSTNGLITRNSTTSNGSFFINYTGLADGVYYYNATAYDSFSHTNSTETRNITLNAQLPGISISYPSNTNYNHTVISLNSTATGSSLSTCWYSLNNGVTNTTFTCNTNITGILSSQGSNTWKVYVNNTFGDLASDSVTFSVDSINPSIQFVPNSETSGTTVNRNTLNVNVTSSDTNFKNVTVYLYNSTSLLFTNSSNLTTFNLTYNLVNGLYFFNATAFDNIGNSNSTETRNVTLNSTAPFVVLTSPANNSSTTNSLVNFTATFTDSSALKNSTFFLWNSANALINSTNFNITGTSNSSTKSFNLTSFDTYHWQYRVCNQNNLCTIPASNFTITYSSPVNPSQDRSFARQILDIMVGIFSLGILASGLYALRYFYIEEELTPGTIAVIFLSIVLGIIFVQIIAQLVIQIL